MLVGLQGDVLRFMQPGMLEQMAVGEAEGMQITNNLLLVAALAMLIPIAMVFLSLALPYRINRWANILIAAFLLLFDAVGLPTYTAAYAVLLIAVGILINLLTVWYAWSWRPQEV